MELIKHLTCSPEKLRLYQQEYVIQEATELICQVMNEEGVSRAELARRLHTTKSYITQMLDGRYKITLRILSDVFTALGRTIHFTSKPLKLK